MTDTPFLAKDIQRFLGVEEDGQWGKATEAAARAKLGQPKDNTGRPWGSKRLIYGVQQAMLVEAGFPITIDGFIGPNTLDAFDRYHTKVKEAGVAKASMSDWSWWQSFKDWWYTDDQPSPVQGKLPVVKAPAPVAVVKPQPAPKPVTSMDLKRNDWPRQKDVEAFYGAKGENQTRIVLPYPMKIAWDQKQVVTTLVCHKKVSASVLRCLNAVKEHYTEEQIKAIGLDLYGGCLNVRKVRGGNTWSMHSWGIAIDFDPDHNQLAWNASKARLAKPDAKAFWQIWEAEGWTSLGRDRDFDWMHVQAAKL